jgi:hypothetical protein
MLVLSAIGIAVVWTTVTVALMYWRPATLQHVAFLAFDVALAVWTAITPSLAQSESFFAGGFPISSPLLIATTRGMAPTLLPALLVAVDRAGKAGRDILLDIDVQGAQKIKRAYPAAVAVFVLPPSLAELARRLSMRGTDDRQVIQRRLANARGEIAQRIHYDYFVVNHDVEQAVRVLSGIVEAERCKVSRVTEWRIEPLRARRRQSSHEQRNQTSRPG